MKLHRIVGRARMCGPSAMSAVTGLPTHDCSALLREVTGRTQIHGVQGYELMAAMALAGWRCERTLHRGASRPTLAAWLRGHDTFAASFVLVVRRHFVALGNGEIADSGWMYERRPQPAATAPYRRVRVRQTIACRPEYRARCHPRGRAPSAEPGPRPPPVKAGLQVPPTPGRATGAGRGAQSAAALTGGLPARTPEPGKRHPMRRIHEPQPNH